MSKPQVTVEVKVSLPYKFSLGDLLEFAQAAQSIGLSEVTWSADKGDQREPSALTLTARPF